MTTATPRWSKFSTLSSSDRIVRCGGCSVQIKHGTPGIAVYHDDQRVEGSATIPTTYYHDECIRCPDCKIVQAGVQMADHAALYCEARMKAREEDGIVPGLFGGELRGTERDAFEDQVLAAARALVDAEPGRFDGKGWIEWRFRMGVLRDLIGQSVLAPIEHNLRVDLRAVEKTPEREDAGEEGYRVGSINGQRHGFVAVMSARRKRLSRIREHREDGKIPPATEWRGKPRRQITNNVIGARS